MTRSCCLRLQWGSAGVEVETTAPRLAATLALVFRPLLIEPPPALDSTPEPVDWSVTVAGESYAAGSLGEGVAAGAQMISRALLHGSGRLLFHAGAVTDGPHTVLILGPSGAGKSTTTLEFVRRGYRFMAEEYTAIDEAAEHVHPYPRCFVLKDRVLPLPAGDSMDLESHRTIFQPAGPIDLEPHRIVDPWIILPRHRHGAEATVRRLSTAELCAQLVQSTFNFDSHEKRLWPALSALAVRARGCALEYRDIQTDLDLALRALAASDEA